MFTSQIEDLNISIFSRMFKYDYPKQRDFRPFQRKKEKLIP